MIYVGGGTGSQLFGKVAWKSQILKECEGESRTFQVFSYGTFKHPVHSKYTVQWLRALARLLSAAHNNDFCLS